MLTPFIPVESFFDSALTAVVWPKSVVTSDFLAQLAQRKKLNDLVEDTINRLPRPDIPLEIAVSQGRVTEEQTTNLYISLSDLLESEPSYKRLVLYFPFELLPSPTHPFGKGLRKAGEIFEQAYMETWRSLLSVHDIRANFVDGDVLEVEQRIGDIPRVVKAAHLIPKLVQRGLMDAKDAITLMENSDDQILKDSIADALSILIDLGFLSKTTIIGERPKTATMPTGVYITKNRRIWLESRERQKVVEAKAEKIKAAILENKVKKVSLLKLLSGDNPDTKEAIFRTLCRLHHLGMFDQKQLTELNIVIPKLEGPFSENLKLIEKDILDIQGIVNSIKPEQELSQLIYPVVLVFGSLLNGYGDQSADIDLAVMVKPGTSLKRRSRLQELLKVTFAHEKIRSDDVKEFWLEEKNGNLEIRNFTESNILIGESYWTHILFGAAWLGDEQTIIQLAEKLLVPYLQDTGKVIHGRDARSLYLEDMEQSLLQYRLMHKGYERFFPPCGGIHTLHADAIDTKSMFWDSGYRQLATRLFVSKVFLPKISVAKNK